MTEKARRLEDTTFRAMISGCSGGGKSTLLAELAKRGYATVAEPGRRILAEERAGDGRALPWTNPAAFALRAILMSISDHEAAEGLTFFDRGTVDAAVALRASGQPTPAAVRSHRYDCVFLAPPWPEIYENDADRRHSLEKALSDYVRVRQAYLDAGYDPIMLPRVTVEGRADFILAELASRLPDTYESRER